MKCDLHVHTLHSGMCTVPVLRRVCRESYTEPGELYETLKQRGMDLVTVTDHDSVDAAESLRTHPDFFASVEVTCTLPSGSELHVGVYDITGRQHIEIQRRRDDLDSLIAYLSEQHLFYSVNHVFSALTGRRAVEDWCYLESVFPGAETRNGAMPERSNRNARAWAGERRLAPLGGSDAHTLRGAGRTFTEVRGARSKHEYLAGLVRGYGSVHGDSGSWIKLTRDVLDIGFSMVADDRRLAPLALLSCLVPVVTAVSFVQEHLFAAMWRARIQAGAAARWGTTDSEVAI